MANHPPLPALPEFDLADLHLALEKLLGTSISQASWQATRLHGGTLGDVWLLEGEAGTTAGTNLPYRMVLKIQRQWERFGDPGSWRRENDLYHSGLEASFPSDFRWPRCYHSELREKEIRLWMEHIAGASGHDLTGPLLAQAARALGHFQGRLAAQAPHGWQAVANLSSRSYLRDHYLHYRSWPEVHDFIRDPACPLPRHLCRMLSDLDEQSEAIFARLEALPTVLCHRDYWIANLFVQGDETIAIDWDTAGWGFLGEDIASLVADEAGVEELQENAQDCLSAYYQGFREFVLLPPNTDPCLREMILLLYGYRMVEWYKFARSEEERQLQLRTLQQVYELGDIRP